MDMVNSNRTMAKTGMNEVSSRSHAALILTLHQYCRKDVSSTQYANKYNKTTFTLMDLAGAERVSKTGGKFVGGLAIFMEIAEANRKGKTPPIGATGALINFELTEMNTAVSKATMKWKQGMKYKVPKGMTTGLLLTLRHGRVQETHTHIHAHSHTTRVVGSGSEGDTRSGCAPNACRLTHECA